MRILVDTNVLFSSLLFPRSKPAQALMSVIAHHELILCDSNIFELKEIIKRKAPKHLGDAEILLSELPFELIPDVDRSDVADVAIRDVKDQPILNAAITYKVDIILTGDKDFLSLPLETPKCMNVADFLETIG